MARKRKILIFGGSGFIGYHLAKFALTKNFQVTSISKKLPKKKRKLNNVKYIFINAAKEELSKKIKGNFDYVINASGYGEHHGFNKKGYDLFYNNYISLVNIVEYFKNKKIKKFIHFGTSFEYGYSQKKIKENFPNIPTSIYGMSKLACTNYLKEIFQQSNFPFTIFRLFQVYGDQQDKNRLIPFVINNCIRNKIFFVSSGNQVRNFCHIDDIVEAVFLSFSNKKTNGEIFNIGSDENFKVKKIVKIINKKIGSGKPIFGRKKLHLGENNKIIPDIQKIKKILKWKSKFTFKNTLNNMIKK